MVTRIPFESRKVPSLDVLGWYLGNATRCWWEFQGNTFAECAESVLYGIRVVLGDNTWLEYAVG